MNEHEHKHKATVCTSSILKVSTREDTEEARTQMREFCEDADKYLSVFAEPVKDDRGNIVCLKCGEELTGLIASFLGRGGFEWGLVHGEGYCRCCKWPGRGMHYPKGRDGKELFTLRNFVLQYHPSHVTRRKTETVTP